MADIKRKQVAGEGIIEARLNIGEGTINQLQGGVVAAVGNNHIF